jgi:hypothetical protein
MANKIHLLTYSNNEPFLSSQKKINETISLYTDKKIVFWEQNLLTIKNKPWFKYINDFSNFDISGGRRDGSHNAWKVFLSEEVLNQMDDGDILYYVDSSRYHTTGFTENVDKLLEFTRNNGHVAGSIGENVKNLSYNCCQDLKVWNYIIDNVNCESFLNKPHVLNSWFLLCKNELNLSFVKEWSDFSKKYLNDIPLISYHHTADQSIFNILVYKYNLTVFFNPDLSHDMNKNFNLVNFTLNKTSTAEKYFKTIL